ncbi:hypothetical protein J6590_038520 [Homalodisca vitripennis]|nr:hypothetical protein J6590_038520 [Homalodisca vitripennis]
MTVTPCGYSRLLLADADYRTIWKQRRQHLPASGRSDKQSTQCGERMLYKFDDILPTICADAGRPTAQVPGIIATMMTRESHKQQWQVSPRCAVRSEAIISSPQSTPPCHRLQWTWDMTSYRQDKHHKNTTSNSYTCIQTKHRDKVPLLGLGRVLLRSGRESERIIKEKLKQRKLT